MKNEDLFKEYREQHKRFQEMAYPKELKNIRKLMGLEVYENLRPLSELTRHSKKWEGLSRVTKFHINQRVVLPHNLSRSMQLATRNFSSVSSYYIKNRMGENLSLAIDMANKNQEILKAFSKIESINWQNRALFPQRAEMKRISSSLASVWDDFEINEVDLDGLDEIKLDHEEAPSKVDNSPSSGHADLSGTLTVTQPKKKLVDMTEDELSALVTKSMTKVGVFSLPVFIYNLYSEYVNDAARAIIEVMFVFCLTFFTGQYNEEVKSEIADNIQESMVVKDVRKVVTKYVKVNPTDQVAFLRKDSHLRKGTSKTSPMVPVDKISKVTVLTILERQNNWVKVQVDTGEACGEIGWVEESKVIKFKKVQ
ncbi:hypothetical protein [Cytobacillus sp. SAFR-174]|uniref:hypothetical protein n=1 Tax=Cytobacillus sp. SAFR-174 TaxID=3436868 RepID=UPI003F7D8322